MEKLLIFVLVCYYGLRNPEVWSRETVEASVVHGIIPLPSGFIFKYKASWDYVRKRFLRE